MSSLIRWLLTTVSICSYAQASTYDLSFFSGPQGYRLLSSSGINKDGQITGWGFNDVGGPDGFLRSSAGVVSTFGVRPGLTQANAINDAGQVVGDYYDDTGMHPFLQQPDGSLQTLHIPYQLFGLTVFFEYASATGINNKGQIVGTFRAGDKNSNAFNGSFLEQSDGTFLAITPSNNTYVSAISNNGYILGTDVVNGLTSPFVMDSSSLQIIRILTNIPTAYGYGEAELTSINSNGDVVGSFDSSYGAFIFNALSDDQGFTSLPSPKYCTAGAINDNGVITGTCQLDYQGFVLTPSGTPTPEPGSRYSLLALMAVGMLLKRTMARAQAQGEMGTCRKGRESPQSVVRTGIEKNLRL